MKQSKWVIETNVAVASKTCLMVVRGDTSGIRPGQFVEIALPNLFLRRPISVCNIDGDRLTLIYKVVGEGTAVMSGMPAGTRLDILSGLGNGYDLSRAGDKVLLVGGGVGVPPLIYAAKRLREMDKQVRVVVGFNTVSEMFIGDTLETMGCKVDVCTMDGSFGKQGVVTDLITTPAPFYYACGPLPMLKALVQKIGTNGQLSLEERMGCGVGICVGCSVQTTEGIKRVCKEGPVFNAGEVIWK